MSVFILSVYVCVCACMCVCVLLGVGLSLGNMVLGCETVMNIKLVFSNF